MRYFLRRFTYPPLSLSFHSLSSLTSLTISPTSKTLTASIHQRETSNRRRLRLWNPDRRDFKSHFQNSSCARLFVWNWRSMSWNLVNPNSVYHESTEPFRCRLLQNTTKGIFSTRLHSIKNVEIDFDFGRTILMQNTILMLKLILILILSKLDVEIDFDFVVRKIRCWM